jgi:LysM repeat protein
LGKTAARIDWEDLAPLVGTVISILFWWHAVSLVAELILLVAASVGWLWNQSLRPLWLLLDVLNSAPHAAPKRLVLATALAGQVLVRSAGPTLVAPLPSQRAIPVLLAYLDQTQPGAAAPEKEEVPSAQVAAPARLTRRVRPGDTLSGIAARYYGHAGYWPVLFKANQGAVMAEPALGLGRPVRLTSPDYLLPGWDVVVHPLPGRLEQGDGGELVYVVQSGDTLSGIARRFGVDVADLAAANAGAQTPDGHVLEDLIWTQLRLRIRPLEPRRQLRRRRRPSRLPQWRTEPAAPVVATPPPAVEPSPLPTATPAPSNGHAVRSGGDEATPAPTASAPAAETPARPGASEPAFGEWPLLVAAGGLSAAALLALRGRRTRRPPAEPESDTQLDVHAFALAEPARVVAARREGGEDPHGIVLGEQVAGALLGHVPGIHRLALQRMRLEDCPVLLCVGLQPDTHAARLPRRLGSAGARAGGRSAGDNRCPGAPGRPGGDARRAVPTHGAAAVHEHVQRLERKGGHREQVGGPQVVGVVCQERAPRLTR